MKPTYEELKAKYGDEKVYVLHRSELEPYLQEGFTEYNKEVYKKMLTKSFLIKRTSAEYNPKFRQVQPYIVLRHGDMLFTTERIGGEPRLIGKLSLGAGGHINSVDNIAPGNIIANCVIRELHEELVINENSQMSSKIIGFINDNSNAVSQDHVAAVVLIDISIPDITVRETDKLTGAFMHIGDIMANYDRLESWSQIVVDVLKDEMAHKKSTQVDSND